MSNDKKNSVIWSEASLNDCYLYSKAIEALEKDEPLHDLDDIAKEFELVPEKE